MIGCYEQMCAAELPICFSTAAKFALYCHTERKIILLLPASHSICTANAFGTRFFIHFSNTRLPF